MQELFFLASRYVCFSFFFLGRGVACCFALQGQAVDLDSNAPGLEAQEVIQLRKKAGIPEMDPEASPSTYVNKIQLCISKRVQKLNDLRLAFNNTKKLTPNQEKYPASSIARAQSRKIHVHSAPAA